MLLVLEWGSPQSPRCRLTSLHNFSYNTFPDNLFISKDGQPYSKSSTGLLHQPHPSPVAQVWNIWIAQRLRTPGRPWVLAEINIIHCVFLEKLTYFLSSLHLLQYIIILHSCQNTSEFHQTRAMNIFFNVKMLGLLREHALSEYVRKKNKFFFKKKKSQTSRSLAKLLFSGSVASLYSVMLLFPQSPVGGEMVKTWMAPSKGHNCLTFSHWLLLCGFSI